MLTATFWEFNSCTSTIDKAYWELLEERKIAESLTTTSIGRIADKKSWSEEKTTQYRITYHLHKKDQYNWNYIDKVRLSMHRIDTQESTQYSLLIKRMNHDGVSILVIPQEQSSEQVVQFSVLLSQNPSPHSSIITLK